MYIFGMQAFVVYENVIAVCYNDKSSTVLVGQWD